MIVAGPEGDTVQLKGERLRTLLVALALTPGRAVSLGALTETLWPDAAPANPANAVQALASRLRAALGRDAVALTPAGYRLALEPDEVDAVVFAEALQAHDYPRALGLWRGAPDLPGHPDEAARLLALRQGAEDEQTDAEIARGNGPAQIAALRAAVAAEPLRERPRAQLLRALSQAGRTGEALATYEEGRAVLAEELGADPSPLLRAAHLAVLTEEEGQQTPPAPSTAHALPAALTSFLGREPEIAALRTALTGSRLVTLIGPGGAGKTRLAIESARSHPTPLRLVELAPVGDPADVPGAVAATMNWREATPTRPVPGAAGADVTERLIDAIGTTDMLLLLDNCEHLVEAAASLSARLLAACPRLRILATSREPLAITGEQLLPVPPLGLPAPTDEVGGEDDTTGFPAVRLFLDRARAVRPGYAPTSAELRAIVTVCRALDGQPLAIELAAARMRSLDPEGIAERLAQRFQLLTGGSRAALPRHRTLRAVVDWSWDLLETSERALLARLSVFSGQAELDAIEQICGAPGPTEGPTGDPAGDEIFDVLAALVDKSLVVRTDAGRYRLLETIRVYAAERLAAEQATTATRDAHAAYYLALAERGEPKLYGPEQVTTLAWFTGAHDNLIAALRWSVERGDASTALRLVAALGWYLWRRGEQGENLPLIHQALALPADGVDPLARAVSYGITALYSLDSDWVLDPTMELLRGAIALRDGLSDPDAHPLLPMLDIMTALFEQKDWQVLDLAQRLARTPNPWVQATGCLFLGYALQNEGRAEEAERTLWEAAERYREVGDLWGQSFVRSGLADFALWRGDPDGAVALWEEAIACEQRMGVNADSPEYRARMIAARYASAGAAEDVAELERLADAARASGSWSPFISTCTALANAYRRSGEPERALPLLEEALSLLDRRMNGLPQIKALLLMATGQAQAACDNIAEAEQAHEQALRSAAASYDGPIIAAALQSYADLALRRDEPELAAFCLGASHGQRGVPDLSSWELARDSAAATERLGESAYLAAYERGRACPRAEVFAELGVELDAPPPHML